MSITHSLQSLFAFYPNYRNSLEASRRRIPEAPQFKASRTRRIPLANDDGVERSKESINALVLSDSLCASRFCCCGRRRFIGASGAALLPILPSNASELERDTTAVLNKFHPPRPDWYEELYASIMDKSIAAYEEEVGEALPVSDASMDAVVGTLVLCSVKDVKLTLEEIKRVLKPGGLYVFMEHVAAQDGTLLRFAQGLLDPLQQIVADGCHLTRDTGKLISEAGFSDVNINTTLLSTFSIIRPHIYGIASK
ncbi:PREDICTED: methyltransferase-like protein 7A isoform X2 [Nelumbo nucifera]|uniref:Methyltransferase-like protein 7A isoform X2 n=1 Tax=Nelumbo nucifera TaxID=4432 RepID=A0A1U8A8R7_NELNU|nr:PREDICTED: methyltransferase-like protein 7A isoform X2 [Nelumbo nucifera]